MKVKEKDNINEITDKLNKLEKRKDTLSKLLQKREDIIEKDQKLILSIINETNRQFKRLDSLVHKKKKYALGYEFFNSYSDMRNKAKALLKNYSKSQGVQRLYLAHQIFRLQRHLNPEKCVIFLKDLIKSNFWNDKINNLKEKENNVKLKKAASQILKDLGLMLTQLNEEGYRKYLSGRNYLEMACRLNPEDPDALATLGGAWKDVDSKKACQYYKNAYKIDKQNPYPLTNYSIYKIKEKENLDLNARTRDWIKKAMEIRSDQIEQLIETPWSFFDLGVYHLILNPEDSQIPNNFKNAVKYFLCGIRFSQESWMIDSLIRTLELIEPILIETYKDRYLIIKKVLLLGQGFHLSLKGQNKTEEYNDVIKRLMQLGLRGVQSNFPIQKHNSSFPFTRLLVLSGDLKHNLTQWEYSQFKEHLIDKLTDFQGGLVIFHTTPELLKLVAELKSGIKDIRTYLYTPSLIKSSKKDKDLTLEDLFDEVSGVASSKLSLDIILKFWFEVLIQQISPNRIKVFGIGGSFKDTSTGVLEYLISIAFGAHLGVFTKSKYAVKALKSDKKIALAPIKKNFKGAKIRVYNELEPNSETDLFNFLFEPFYKDLDKENINAFLIYDLSGAPIYKIKFYERTVDNIILGGLLSSIEHLFQEMGFEGNQYIPGKKVDETFMGYLGKINLFSKRTDKKEYIIQLLIILNRKPSPKLKQKIELFKDELLSKFLDDFEKLARKGNAYGATPIESSLIDDLVADIFGKDLVKNAIKYRK